MGLTVIDLFAGCGGLSLGFQRAGFDILGGVEHEKRPAETHALNFFRDAPEAVRERHSQAIDITATPPEQFVRQVLGVEPAALQLDVVAGGPPCQAFSRVGRAKLRDLMEHPEAYLQDERADLYIHFLEYVEFLQPRAVLMENVVDIVNYGGKNVAEEIAWSLHDMGYHSRYTVLNAVQYGVPQYRQRFFLIAYRDDLGLTPTFPAPTHRVEEPEAYEDRRKGVMTAVGQPTLFDQRQRRYVRAPKAEGELPDAVSVADALADLPVIELAEVKRDQRNPDRLKRYRDDVVPSAYSRLMRTWPGYESAEGVSYQVTRYLPRDFRIFARMKPGDLYPDAHGLAEALFEEELARQARENGRIIEEESEAYEQLRAAYVPPYDPGKFKDKWRKLDPHQPVHTLTAHMSRDTYSHIHYDSEQKRTISVREAARLQSFPDGFEFTGGMGPAFRMIGNAVPPLLAHALAKEMRRALEEAEG